MNLTTGFILFGLFQTIVITILLWKKGAFHNNKAILLLLLAFLIVQTEPFLIYSQLIFNVPLLVNFSVPFTLLIGPLIYFMTFQDRKTNLLKAGWPHLLLFLFYFIYSFNFYLQPEGVKVNAIIHSFYPEMEVINVNKTFASDPWNIQGIFVVELISLHLIGYSLWSFIKGNVTDKTRNFWLKGFGAIGVVGGLMLLLSQGGIINGNVLFSPLFPAYFADIFSSIAVYSITILLISNPKTLLVNGTKYKNSMLPHDLQKHYLNKILNAFEIDKSYRDQEFSLSKLADNINVSKHHISQTINTELGKTFFELVNEYRIKEAMDLLDNKNEITKIDILANELGYKSKATFYKAFKQIASCTPASYMKSQ